jgi:hypothetical protein
LLITFAENRVFGACYELFFSKCPTYTGFKIKILSGHRLNRLYIIGNFGLFYQPQDSKFLWNYKTT